MWNMSGAAQANYLGKVFNLPDEHHTLHVNFRQYRKNIHPFKLCSYFNVTVEQSYSGPCVSDKSGFIHH